MLQEDGEKGSNQIGYIRSNVMLVTCFFFNQLDAQNLF